MCKMGDKEEEQKLEGVTEVNDSDVLCGRGGAALRHAGNQTYRKLVSLNKGLYITCLKTEKLKISRSIVAAIREKKGRFLEKDAKTGTWYDIGDKKAVEKTSQALREGQPKLRQQIVEMGGGAAGAASLIESQFGPQAAAAVAGAGLYAQAQHSQMQGGPASIMTHNQQQMAALANGSLRQQMMNQQGYPAMQHQQQPQPQQRQMSGLPFDDIQNDLMSRLSLHDDTSGMPPPQGNMQMRQMMSSGMGMPGAMSQYNGYGGAGQMTQMRAGDGSGVMPDSFHMAIRGMASPNASIQNSLHSTQHTLDFSSMHSLDLMSGLSGHSIGMLSNHTMGPPSAHMPSMSSMPRQQQIDERYPQNIGLNPQAMSQSFQRQAQDSQPPQPPPQPPHPQRHVGSDMPSIQEKFHPGQPTQMYPGQHIQMNPGQPVRGYDGMGPQRGVTGDFEPVPAYPNSATNGLPGNPPQQGLSVSDEYALEPTRLPPGGFTSGEGARVVHREQQPRYDDDPGNDPRLTSSLEGNPKDGGTGGGGGGGGGDYAGNSSTNNQSSSANMASMASAILSPETRQKMVDRRSILAKMKYRKPPSIRDTKMSGLSTHSTGDGMPDIYMVESARSLHSTLSNMTDGTSLRPTSTGTPSNAGGGGGGSRDPWVETARVVDHSSRDYMDVLAMGSKHSLMSGLSKISDHSFNDVSIFSGLSNKIGNVSTRSIAAMSEISVVEVAAEKEDEEEEAAEGAGASPPSAAVATQEKPAAEKDE